MEVSGQLHAPAALPPAIEPPVPIEQEAGRAPGPDRALLPLPGIEIPAVQPVAGENIVLWVNMLLGIRGGYIK
jgi:hypothetical protein